MPKNGKNYVKGSNPCHNPRKNVKEEKEDIRSRKNHFRPNIMKIESEVKIVEKKKLTPGEEALLNAERLARVKAIQKSNDDLLKDLFGDCKEIDDEEFKVFMSEPKKESNHFENFVRSAVSNIEPVLRIMPSHHRAEHVPRAVKKMKAREAVIKSRAKNIEREKVFVEPTASLMDYKNNKLESKEEAKEPVVVKPQRKVNHIHPNKVFKINQTLEHRKKKKEAQEFRINRKLSKSNVTSELEINAESMFDDEFTIRDFAEKVTASFKKIPEVFKILYPAAIMIYQVYRSTGYTDIFAAVLQYANVIMAKGVNVEYLSGLAARLFETKFNLPFFKLDNGDDLPKDYLPDKTDPLRLKEISKNIRKELMTKGRSVLSEINSESLSSRFDDLKSIFSAISQSEFILAIRDVVLSLASFHWFSKDVAKNIFKHLGKPLKMNTLELIEFIANQLSILLRFGDRLCEGMSLSDICFSKTPVRDTTNRIRKLMRYKDKLYQSIPLVGVEGMNRKDFVRQADVLLATATSLLKSAHPLLPATIDLKHAEKELFDYVFEQKKACSAAERNCPIGIVIHGDPGVGKGRLVVYTAKIIADVKGVAFDPDDIFHRVPSSDFWEGYLNHSIIHCSERGSDTQKIVESKGDKIMEEILSIMDSIPMCLNMASLGAAGKGNVYCNADAAIIDTNRWDLNVKYMKNNWSAVYRRMVFTEMQVMPEFRLPNSTSLDKTKALASGRKPMDFYQFQVRKWICNGNTDGYFVDLLNESTGHDIYAYTNLMYNLIRKHFEEEDETREKMAKVTPVDYLNNFSDEKNIESESLNFHIGKLPRVDYSDYKDFAWQTTVAISVIISAFSTLVTIMFMIFMCRIIRPWIWRCGGSTLAALFWWLPYTFIPKILSLIVISIMLGGEISRLPIFTDLCLMYVKMQMRAKMTNAYKKLRYLFYFDKSFPHFDGKMWFMYGSAIVAAISAYKVLRRMFCSQIAMETSSSFINDPELSKELNDIEDLFGMDVSVKRYKSNGDHWITQKVVPHKGSFTGEPSSLLNTIARNVRVGVFRVGDSQCKNYIVGLKGNLALTNTHAFKGAKLALVSVSRNGLLTADMNNYATMEVGPHNRIDLPNDITVFRMSEHIFSNITHHLVDNINVGRHNGAFWKSYLDHEVRVEKHDRVLRIGANSSYKFTVDSYFEYVWPDHNVGECGKPLIVKTGNSSAIAGLHVGGLGINGYATPVNKTLVMNALSELEGNTLLMPISSEGAILQDEFLPPVPKSSLNYVDLSALDYFGRIPGDINVNRKSKVMKTKFHDSIPGIIERNFGYKIKKVFGPPVMKRFINEEKEWIDPYNVAFQAMNSPKKHLDQEILSLCVGKFSDRILRMLNERGVESLRPLNIETAINGAVDDQFLRRINAHTSGGYGYPGGKDPYIPLVDEIKREPIGALKGRLIELFKSYMECETAGIIIKAALKDEPIETRKIKIGKTRLFYVTPLDALILSRAILAPFFTLMVEHPDIFCCALGINMHKEADQIAAMQAFGEKWLQGDYEFYDIKLPWDIRWAGSSVTYFVLKSLGYSAPLLRVVQTCLTENLFPLVNILNDVFYLLIQISGKYATAEINSGDNVIALMYAWYSHPKLVNLDFFDFVKPKTYGDDITGPVKDEVIPYFNNIYYSKFCEEVYGMKFTTADKTAEMPLFNTFDTVDFLKRKIVFSRGKNKWMGQLDIESIAKSLMWTIPSENVSPSDQLIGTVTSALWEGFMHLEEKEFESFRDDLVDLMSEHYTLGDRIKTPSFQQIFHVIVNNGKIMEDEVTDFEELDINSESMVIPIPAYQDTWIMNAKLMGALLLYIFLLPICWYFLFVHILELYFMLASDIDRIINEVKSSLKYYMRQWFLQFYLDLLSEGFGYLDITLAPRDHSLRSSLPIGSYLGLSRLTRCPFQKGGRGDVTLFEEKLYEISHLFLNTEARTIGELKTALLKHRERLDGLHQIDQARLNMYNRATLRKMLVHTVDPSKRKAIHLQLNLLSEMRSCDETINRMNYLEEEKFVNSESLEINSESEELTGVMMKGPPNQILDDENFTEAPGAEVEYEDAGESKYSDHGQQNLLNVDDFFSRPNSILYEQLAPSTDISLSLSIWDVLTQVPAYRAKWRNFAYLGSKSVIKVRLSVSGTPFHKGMLLISYQPYAAFNQTLQNLLTAYAANTSFRPLLLAYLSQAPGSVLLNVKDNKPVEISIPFISTKPMHRLYNPSAGAIGSSTSYVDMINAGTLYIYTLNQIGSVSSSPSEVYLQVYSWFDKIQLGTATATQAAIATESGDERTVGPVESVASRIAAVAKALSSVPIIGPFAKASSMFASGVGVVASIFGWSKPIMNSEPLKVKSEPYQNGALAIGYETGHRIVWDPKQELTVDPRVLGNDEDEMSFKHIYQRWGYLQTFTWAHSSAALSVLWTSRIHPNLVTYFIDPDTNVYAIPTPLSYIASMFEYWRGDIEIMAQFVCSEFHRGKFAFGYEPNMSQVSLIESAPTINKQYMRVFDLQETQTVVLRLNWASYRPWLKTNTAASAYVNTAAPTNSFNQVGYTNGYLFLMPFTGLQSPDNSDIQVNIFIRGVDMHFNGVTSINMPTQRLIPSESGEVFVFPNKTSDYTSTRIERVLLEYDFVEDAFELADENTRIRVEGAREFPIKPVSFDSYFEGNMQYVHIYEDLAFKLVRKKFARVKFDDPEFCNKIYEWIGPLELPGRMNFTGWERSVLMKVSEEQMRYLHDYFDYLDGVWYFTHYATAFACESVPDIEINSESGNCNIGFGLETIDLNESSAQTSTLSQEFFGEEVISFRTLLKRFVTDTVFSVSGTGQRVVGNISTPIYPPNNMPYGSSTFSLFDFFSYSRYAFVGVRGGIRVRPRFNLALARTYGGWTRLSLGPPSNADGSGSINNSTSDDNQAFVEGTTTFVENTNGGVEAEFPFYSNNLFLLSFASNYVQDNSNDCMEAVWYRNFIWAWDTFNIASTQNAMSIDRASAEDFSLMRFQGCPYYSAAPVI